MCNGSKTTASGIVFFAQVSKCLNVLKSSDDCLKVEFY